MLSVIFTKQFQKDYKRIKNHISYGAALRMVVDLLLKETLLPIKYKDHPLKGNMSDFRECHIKPDLLLIYKKDMPTKTVVLVRVGSHSALRLA